MICRPQPAGVSAAVAAASAFPSVLSASPSDHGEGGEASAAHGEAHGGEGGGGHHGSFLGQVVFPIINFAILAAALYFVARRGVRSHFYQRSEAIRQTLEKAREAQRNAEAHAEELQARLRRLDADVGDILAEARRLAATEKAQLIAQAQADAERLRADAERQTAYEVEAARAMLSGELMRSSLSLAESLLTRELKADDHKRLFEEFVGQVGSLPKAPA